MSRANRPSHQPSLKKTRAANPLALLFRRLRAVEERYLYPAIFCLLSLCMGTVAAFTIPPLQVPDEWAHLLRAVDTASGRCVAQPDAGYDGAILELEDTFRAPLESMTPLAQQKAFAYLKDPAQHAQMGRQPGPSEKPAANLYSCVPYMASSVPWLLSKPFGIGNVSAFYAGRFANLLVYTALTAAALGLLPTMRLGLLVVALLPMTLQQAASYSADSLALGLSFLFLALCLHFAYWPGVLRWQQWCALCAVALPLTLSKFNVFLLLTAILIPSARFAGRKHKVAAIGLLLGLCFATAGAWQALNQGNTQRYAQFKESFSIHLDQNAAFLREDILGTAVLLGQTFVVWSKSYLIGMVSILGHLQHWPPMEWTVALLCLMVVAAVLPDGGPRPNGRQKLVLLAAFVCSLVSMLLLLFVFETDAERLALARAHDTDISGVQGRYLLPIVPLLLLALPKIPERWRIWPNVLPAVAAVVLLVGANLQIFAFFGNVYGNYRNHLVAVGPLDGKLVHTKEEPQLLFVIARGVRYMVRDDKWSRQYGLRQPEDVVELQAAELKAIPQGESISSFQATSGRALPLPWETAARRYEGQFVASEEDPSKIFLVEGGARRPLSAKVLAAHPGLHEQRRVISTAEFVSLPLGGVVHPEQMPIIQQ